jgi:Ca2+-binding EF-hand superfamily protein
MATFGGADRTKDERQLQEVFALANASGNRLLSIPELVYVLELMGRTYQQHEVLGMVASVNTRATNDLTFEEFVKLMNDIIDEPYSDNDVEEAWNILKEHTDTADTSGTSFMDAQVFRVSPVRRV